MAGPGLQSRWGKQVGGRTGRTRQRMMRAALIVIAGGAFAAACDDSPTGAEGLCIGVVNVHGVFFTTTDASAPDPSLVASEPYLTVSRDTGCLDQGEPSDPLAHGESNFLAAGTDLHEVEGYAATERLVVWSDVVDEWRVLGPVE